MKLDMRGGDGILQIKKIFNNYCEASMKIFLFILAPLLMAFVIHCDRDENNGTGPSYDRKDVYLNVSVKDADGEGIYNARVSCRAYYYREDYMDITAFPTNKGGYVTHKLSIIAKEDGNDTVLVVVDKTGFEDSDIITVLPLQDGHTETLNFVLNQLE